MIGKYVIIGNSAAALAATGSIRKYDHDGSMLLLNRETGPAYSRVALPYYVSGELTLEQLLIRQRADYATTDVELVENANVVRIDADGRQVELADGRRVGYEKLLIATGSVCAVPPIRGLETITPHYLWTLEDAKRMRTAAERARTAVVIGGGFIGMLIAEALRKLGIRLTIVEMAPQLLPQLLDAEGGALFLDAVKDEGVTVRLKSVVEAVAKVEGQTEVTLRGGETVAADMVAVAAGVRPDVSVVANGPCAINKGVLVNEHLETSCPGVYAAGDVAEVKDFLSADRTIHAIWPVAVDQGVVAGANMAGKRLAYPGSLGMNVVELFKLTLAEVGRFRESATDDVKLLGGSGSALYRKVVVDREGRLAGAMYLGDPNGVAEMGVLHGMIKRRAYWRELAQHRQARISYAYGIYAAARGV
jgi:NADPH-dependent 2,4-dienoyl-CoA reductase/sulfur reductase-like enzyme